MESKIRNKAGFAAKLLFLLSLPALALGFTPQPDSPLANHSHPRLHLTQKNLPAFRQELGKYFNKEYQQLVTWAANEDVDSKGNTISDSRHNPLRALLVNQAFIAAIGKVDGIGYPIPLEAYAERAISRLIDQLKDGETLSYAAALTYDWTFNFMTVAQRQEIANMMLERNISNKAIDHSIANPVFTPDQLFSSKYFEGCYAWYIALAFWGDGFIDKQADRAVDTFYDIMLNYGYLDAQNFVADGAGGWAEWIGYSSWHPRTHLLLVDGWRTATGEDFISKNTLDDGNAIKNYPTFISYAVDPFEYANKFYTYLRMGDAETSETSLEHGSMREQFFTLTGILSRSGLMGQAGLVKRVIKKYKAGWPDKDLPSLWFFLGMEGSVPAKSPEELNFKKSMWSRNLGVFIARTGFENQADGVFFVTASHFLYDGHDGPDDRIGFGLVKYGALVNTREVAHRGYGNLEDYPGAHRENSVFFEGDHRLHHKMLNNPSDLKQASNERRNFDQGGIEQVTSLDNAFFHVRVNFDRQLDSTVSHTREYVWLPGNNPSTDSDFLVVYDRCKAPSRPHWIYHVPWKPSVTNFKSSENITTGRGTKDRLGEGFTGKSMVIKSLNGTGGEKDSDGGKQDFTAGLGAHGVCFSRTLLPATARVEISRVASLDKQVLKRQHHLAIKSHRWQIDIMPVENSREQRFLNIFQTADANTTSSMAQCSAIDAGSSLQGVWIASEAKDRPNIAVLFNKQYELIRGAIRYSVNGIGKVRHVIVGLRPEFSYDIKIDGPSGAKILHKKPETDVRLWDYKGIQENKESGVLYFESEIGGLTTIDITPAGN